MPIVLVLRFSVTLMTVPACRLMMGKALADIFALKATAVRSILDFLGEPMFCPTRNLLAIFTLGKVSGMNRDAAERRCGAAPDRWHLTHRRRRRGFKADPRRHWYCQAARQRHCPVLDLPALIMQRRVSIQFNDQLSDSGNRHRSRHPGTSGSQRRPPARHCWFGDRLREFSFLLTRQ